MALWELLPLMKKQQKKKQFLWLKASAVEDLIKYRKSASHPILKKEQLWEKKRQVLLAEMEQVPKKLQVQS